MANFTTYIKDVWHELTTKVSWPTWKELQSSTVLVLVASVIFSVLIFLMDYIFGINSASAEETGFVWRGLLGYYYETF